MDIFLVYVGILCASTFLLFSFYRKKLSAPKNLPPGNTGWPIIGEMWDFVMASQRGTPEKYVTERMKKYSPDVFKTNLLGEKMVVFCGAAGNKFLFSGHDKYVGSWYPASVKKILAPAEDSLTKESSEERMDALEFLKPKALQNYIPIMDSFAKQQVETDWSPYQQVKVSALSKAYTFGLACKLLMNRTDPSSIKRIKDPFLLIATGLFSLPVNIPGTAFHRAIKAGKFLREELLATVKQRRKDVMNNVNTTGADMLTRLVKESGVDDLHIAYRILGLLLASYDSTSTVTTFIIYYLEKYQHIYDMVYREQMEIAKSKKPGELLNWDDVQNMKYSWWVACETLRISPPAAGTFREAIVDFTFAGYSIPKGWKAYWTVNSTHKNPEYFPDPEKFDPTRFDGDGPIPYSFVPFGGGRRMCPGKEYARVAILVYMHNLVTKFKFKSLNPDEKITYKPNPTPADGLLVKLVSHDEKKEK